MSVMEIETAYEQNKRHIAPLLYYGQRELGALVKLPFPSTLLVLDRDWIMLKALLLCQ